VTAAAGTGPVPDELAPLRPGGTGAPLYCVPAAGGSAASYLGLVELLPAGRPVFGFECPGPADGRVPLDSVSGLAQEYAASLLARGSGPHHLLGWSLGAAVAFETARLVLAGQGRMGALIMVDPPLPQPGVLPTESEIARLFLADLAGGPVDTEMVPTGVTDLAAGDPASMFDELLATGVLPADLDTEFLLDRYAVFLANVTALVKYTPGGRYAGAATLIKAGRSPVTTPAWRALLDRITEHRLAADHYSIMTGDALTEVARRTGDAMVEFDQQLCQEL
jgi:thioesterase domain-containing protein